MFLANWDPKIRQISMEPQDSNSVIDALPVAVA